MMKTTTMSKQDIDASRKEYEMRKQQQQDQQGISQTDSVSASASTTTMQQQSSSSSTSNTQMSSNQLSERRQSLKEYLLMDPATQHANDGILDPSAILRGENNSSKWNQADNQLPIPRTSLK